MYTPPSCFYVLLQMEKLLTSLDHRLVEDELQLGLVLPQTPDRQVI